MDGQAELAYDVCGFIKLAIKSVYPRTVTHLNTTYPAARRKATLTR